MTEESPPIARTPEEQAAYESRLAEAATLMNKATTELAAQHSITLLAEALALACGLPGGKVTINGVSVYDTPGYAEAWELRWQALHAAPTLTFEMPTAYVPADGSCLEGQEHKPITLEDGKVVCCICWLRLDPAC